MYDMGDDSRIMISSGKRARRGRGRWRFPVVPAIACVVILVGTCVFLYPQVASWFSQREQSRVTELAQELMHRPPNNDPVHRSEQIQQAHEYNNALASGAVYKANEHVAVGDGTSSDASLDYDKILAVTPTGFMARLRYDALGIDLPIYHGTADATLEEGVGHLEGTSFPVGGVGTRAVLTAHRGLPTATLFNDLDSAKVGDRFTISVLDEVLTYQVAEIKVIEPSDTESILADPVRDLVTLVTCTPLGINTHRILVTAERVTPTPIKDVEAAAKAPEIPGFPWWAIILAATFLALVLYVWGAGYPPRQRKRPAPLADPELSAAADSPPAPL